MQRCVGGDDDDIVALLQGIVAGRDDCLAIAAHDARHQQGDQLVAQFNGIAVLVLATDSKDRASLTRLVKSIAASATTAFVVANGGQAALPEGIVHGYTVAFTWGAGIMAVAAIVTFTMIKPQQHELEPTSEHTVLVG